VHVIGHHYVGVQPVALKPGVSCQDGSSHDTSDFWAAQRGRSGLGGIEKPVHGRKSLSVGGQDIRAKAASAGKTAMQPESDEQRNPHHLEVRQPTFAVCHEMYVGIGI